MEKNQTNVLTNPVLSGVQCAGSTQHVLPLLPLGHLRESMNGYVTGSTWVRQRVGRFIQQTFIDAQALCTEMI